VIPNESTAASDTPPAARQAALNAVLRRLVANQPRTRSGASAESAPPPTPSGAAQLAPVPRWLTAPVLRLAIPDSPMAAGTAAPSPPPPSLPPKPEPVPEAAASEVLEVPPLVEPIAAPKPKSQPPANLAARIMSEIATIVAQAPEAVVPVVVDLSALETPDAPGAAPAVPSAASPAPPAPAAPLPAAPRPVLAQGPRAEPARRVPVRRTRPRVDHPQRRLAPPAPPKHSVAGEARPARPAAAAQPAPSPQPAASPAAKAPAPESPASAPAASVARTLTTAAVPETRPLTQNRRLYRRVRLTAELEVAGKPCRLVDLSIGGFAAASADKFDQGALVPVTLRIMIDGINIGTQFSARMVYGNGTRAAGRFIDLTGAQTAFLRYIVTWRGEAIGAAGTTTLLDAITRWPERAFQPHPSTVKPERERPGFWSRLVGRIPLLGWRKRDQ
jgi:hypothetical protein